MKNRIIQFGLIIMSLIICNNSFSQDKKEQKISVRPALLVIDIQNAFLAMMDGKEKEMAMTNINYYIKLFRSHDCPVILIYHQSKEYGVEPGTDQFKFPASVLIEPGDTSVIKTYPDAFNKTDLNKVIKEKGCNTLFLCGLSAVGCVLSTWVGAYNNDYKAFLIKDAIMSHNPEYTDNVEEMFNAVSYDVINMILESSEKRN